MSILLFILWLTRLPEGMYSGYTDFFYQEACVEDSGGITP